LELRNWGGNVSEHLAQAIEDVTDTASTKGANATQWNSGTTRESKLEFQVR